MAISKRNCKSLPKKKLRLSNNQFRNAKRTNNPYSVLFWITCKWEPSRTGGGSLSQVGMFSQPSVCGKYLQRCLSTTISVPIIERLTIGLQKLCFWVVVLFWRKFVISVTSLQAICWPGYWRKRLPGQAAYLEPDLVHSMPAGTVGLLCQVNTFEEEWVRCQTSSSTRKNIKLK